MKVIGKNVNRYLVACRVTDDLSPDFEKFRHVNFNRTRYEKNGRVQSKREPQAFFLSLLLTFFVFLTTVFAAKDVPMYHITAVQGDPVYLPCDISTNEEGDGMVIVLWYKGDSGTPIYSLDTRDRSLEQAERWSSETAFSSRAYFITEKSTAELGIERIYESDAGIYRCRVDFKRAQTRNSKVNLTVIVPPNKIVILDEAGIERTSVVGPYSEGSNLLLKCDVYGGDPTPTVNWLKNDLRIGEVVESSGNRVRAEIALENLRRGDLHSELTCQASNNNRTRPLSSTVHIDMNFPPLDVRILGSTQSLSAGRRYDLLCQSSGSRPPASITWWKNGQRLEKTKETTSNDGNTTTSTLSFVASKEDAGKYLACRSVNTVLSSEGLEDGWKLQIQYVPETKIELGKSLNPETIREGTDVYFDCLVNAQPQIYKVEWRHNGRQLHHNVGQGIIISNQSLVLQGVSRLSAGNYTCVGFNTEGDGESLPFYLNVLYAPTCKPNQTRVHGVAKNEKANISCAVDANPMEVAFRWLFNNSAESIDVASSHITKSGTVSVVSYTPKTEMDYGTLLCWARNTIGDQKVPCVFHIIAAGRPDPVHNCTKANMSMTSFSVKCGEGFNGGMPQSFNLEILESYTQILRVNLTSNLPRFNVGGLEPGMQYKALIYAFNQKGKSDPVVLPVLTLRLPEKQFTSEEETPSFAIHLSPTMTIAALGGGALVLIVSVIALFLRLRRSATGRGRRKSQKNGQEVGAVTSGSKLDQSGCDSGDSDEKNPDVIPQPVTVEEEDRMDYVHKRQHISTIETSSPTRGPLASGLQGPGPQGYCTLRNGMPLREMTHCRHPMDAETIYAGGACTLPRSHWTQPLRPQPNYPIISSVYSRGNAAPIRIPSSSFQEEEATPETPLMISKKESTV